MLPENTPAEALQPGTIASDAPLLPVRSLGRPTRILRRAEA